MRMSEEEYKNFQNKKAPKVVSKFRSIKKEVNGLQFDSVKEANRYITLLAWQQSGQITELETHKPLSIDINGQHVCNYEADFVYKKDGLVVVEDIKSAFTRKLQYYRLKRKLVQVCLEIEIIEL